MVFLGKVPNYMDPMTQFVPIRVFIKNSISSGIFPLWNPYQAGGVTVIGNPQAALLYPINLILDLLFPINYSYGLSNFLHFLLGGLFLYLFLRSLNIKRASAILAGLCFSLSGFLLPKIALPPMLQTMIWFPLMLYGVEKVSQDFNFKNLFILSFSILFSSLSGYPEFFYYSLVFAFLFLIFRTISPTKSYNHIKDFFRKLFLSLCSFFSGVLLSSIQVLPVLENLKNSTQAVELTFENFLKLVHSYQFNFTDYLTHLVIPTKSYVSNPYIGSMVALISLVFLIYAFFRKTKSRAILFFFVALSLLDLAILSGSKYVQMATYFIPFFKYRWPNLGLTGFLTVNLCVILGISFDELFFKLRGFSSLKVSLPFSLAGLLLAFVISYYFKAFLVPAMGLTLFMVVISIKQYPIPFKQVLLGTFILIELLFGWQKQELIYLRLEDQYEKVDLIEKIKEIDGNFRTIGVDFEKRYSYRWRHNYVTLMPNVSSIHGIYDAQVYDPVKNKLYEDFVNSLSKYNYYFYPNNDRYRFLIIHPYDTRLTNALSVKYVLSNYDLSLDEKEFSDDLVLIGEQHFQNKAEDQSFSQYLYLYENRAALPRASVVGEVDIRERDEKPSFPRDFNFTKRAIIQSYGGDSPKEIKSNKIKSAAKIVQYSNNFVKVRVETDQAGYLILTDAFFPGWQAYLDGERTPIYMANGAFRAVLLPPGKHEVVFRYFPFSFLAGLSIFAITIAVLATLLVFKRAFAS